MTRINLTDDSDTIALKIRKAKTDREPLPSADEGLEERPEARNLVGIYAALAEQTNAQVLAERMAAPRSRPSRAHLPNSPPRSSRRSTRKCAGSWPIPVISMQS